MNDRIEQAALGMTRGDPQRLARDLLAVFGLRGWAPLPNTVDEGPDLATWAQQTAGRSELIGGKPSTGRRPRFVGGANV